MAANKIVITISNEPEDETPEHSEKATHSTPGYAKAVREQMKRAKGRWGWCIVKVTADLHGVEGTSYLSNCSYLSAEDFALNSGYLPQMIEEAIKEAALKLAEAQRLTKLAEGAAS
jgi:hypothetical protein